MSVEMRSQGSDDDDYDETMEEDEEYDDYYGNDTDDLDLDKPKKTDDPEYFDFELLQTEGVERLLNEEVEALCTTVKVSFRTSLLFKEVKPFFFFQSVWLPVKVRFASKYSTLC